MRRMIAQEEIGIYVESNDPSGCCQLDHGPVVPRRTLAAALPTIHPFAPVGIFIGDENTPARFDEIFLFGKKIVGSIQHFSTEAPGGEVGQFGECRGILNNLFYFLKSHLPAFLCMIFFFW